MKQQERHLSKRQYYALIIRKKYPIINGKDSYQMSNRQVLKQKSNLWYKLRKGE